jgi:hypothetical protein
MTMIGEALMMWYSGYRGRKIETWMSVRRVIKIEMTYFLAVVSES